jgi:hypothetical protein
MSKKKRKSRHRRNGITKRSLQQPLGWVPTLNKSYFNYTKHQKRKRGEYFSIV